MRISKRKTTAAVLRYILKEPLDRLSPDFLNWVGCSIDLWRKLENGDRRMTERMAALLEARIGISRVWLMAGKPKAPPIAVDGSPFTLEWFRSYRASLLTEEQHPFAVYPGGHLVSLIGTAIAAARSGRLASFAVELEAAVGALRKNFGYDEQAAAAAFEAMQANAKPYLLEVSDKGRESEGDRATRMDFLLNTVVRGGAFPTSAVIRSAKDGSTKLTVTGAAHPTKPLKIRPRSKRAKAKP